MPMLGRLHKAFKRTNNSWLFVRASLSLANYHLPLNVALVAATCSCSFILTCGVLPVNLALVFVLFCISFALFFCYPNPKTFPSPLCNPFLFGTRPLSPFNPFNRHVPKLHIHLYKNFTILGFTPPKPLPNTLRKNTTKILVPTPSFRTSRSQATLRHLVPKLHNYI